MMEGVALPFLTPPPFTLFFFSLGAPSPSFTKVCLRGGGHLALSFFFLFLGLGVNPIPSLATTSFWLLKRSLRFFSPCIHDTRPFSSCSFNFAFSSTRCTCSQHGLVAFALSIRTI